MSIAVDTKDCTALSDTELVEMADLCAEGPHGHEVGTLSKQAETWVLVAQARDEGKLKGFAGGGGMQRMAAAMWKGPDYDTIVPRESRDNLEAMVDSLIQRLFQRKLSGNARESFIAYAKEKKGAIFTNQEVGELMHLMMSTPHYQLT